MSTLEDALLGAYEEPEIPAEPEAVQQLRERFKIQNDDQADWALRKIAKIRARKTEAQNVAEAEYNRIQAWLNKEIEGLNREETFFVNLLQEYHFVLLAEDPKRKTLSLPAGKCKMREQPPEFTRVPDKLIEYLESRGLTEFVKVKKEPDWAAYKKRVTVVKGTVVDTETGEIVEGVTAQERGPAFSVEV